MEGKQEKNNANNSITIEARAEREGEKKIGITE